MTGKLLWNTMTPEQILGALRARLDLPSGGDLYAQALRSYLVRERNSDEWIRQHFSQLIEDVQVATYELYLEVEAQVASEAIAETFGELLPADAGKEEVFRLFGANFWALDRFFLSLTQGRRSRAGGAFEKIVRDVLERLSIPFTAQPEIDGRPDFVLPSIEHYHNNPVDCLIFTLKRSLRERWRQITTEGAHGHMFFLGTIDESLRSSDLADMMTHRIYVVVPDRIKNEAYASHQNVISFETFLEHYVEPSMKRWRATGTIAL